MHPFFSHDRVTMYWCAQGICAHGNHFLVPMQSFFSGEPCNAVSVVIQKSCQCPPRIRSRSHWFFM